MVVNCKACSLFGRCLKSVWWLIVIIICVGAFAGWQFVRPADRAGEYRAFIIQSGASGYQISSQLKSLGLIKSSYWFEAWLRLSGQENSLLSGYYSLPSNINIINLTKLLSSGFYSNLEISVRLQEGWTIAQMADYLALQGLWSAEDFIGAVSQEGSVQNISAKAGGDILNSFPGGSLEGYLFPDTYRIYRDSVPFDLAVKMVSNLENKFPPEWRELMIKGGFTVHQTLVLASIVEKEVPSLNDRKKVADVFLKRLKANMGLQADSTINYITGKSVPAVSATDLQIDSAYNTYKYRGLPPGPISAPSRSAIEAVVFPESNDYWFFLTTPEGRVIYSRTFDEHRSAKAQYLR